MKKRKIALSLLIAALLTTTTFSFSNVEAATTKESGQTIYSQRQLQNYLNLHGLKSPTLKTDTNSKETSTSTQTINLPEPTVVRTITDRKELENYCKEHNLPSINEQGKKLKSIKILESIILESTPAKQAISDKEATLVKNSSITSSTLSILDVIDITYPMNFTGSNYCATAKGPIFCFLGQAAENPSEY